MVLKHFECGKTILPRANEKKTLLKLRVLIEKLIKSFNSEKYKFKLCEGDLASENS